MDTKVCRQNAIPPNVGNLFGAGTIIKGDECFSNPILRVTDSKTDPSVPGHSYMADSSGSGEVSISNNDDTCFYTGMSGGGYIPWKFDSVSMKASRIYGSEYPASNGIIFGRTPGYNYAGGGVFDHVLGHCTFVGLNDENGHLESVDLNRASPPKPVMIADLTKAKCVGGIPAKDWFGGMSVDDNRIVIYGGDASHKRQDAWNLIIVYDRTLGGCWVLDMTTGQAHGDWGQTGAVNIADRFGYHQVRPSLDGKYLQVTKGICYTTCKAMNNYYLAVPGSVAVLPVTNPVTATGHKCPGYKHYYNGDVFTGGTYRYGRVLYSDPTGVNAISTSEGKPAFQHCSSDSLDSEETSPIFDSDATSAPAGQAPMFAWEGEVKGITQDGSGKVIRFAHTYADPTNCVAGSFAARYGIGSVFRSGRWFLFSSCWGGTLGNTNGSSNSCKYAPGGNCRGDAFIVKLQ